MNARGFTLVEMLATLLVVSLVSAVVSQGLYQMAQAERRLNSQNLKAQALSLQKEWIRDLLQGLTPFSMEDRVFRGGPDYLFGFSTMLPTYPEESAAWFRLELRYDEGLSQTSLWLIRGPQKATEKSELPEELLSSWEGKGAKFEYIGSASGPNTTHSSTPDPLAEMQPSVYESWPPPLASHFTQLPQVIRLHSGNTQMGSLLATPMADLTTRPSRKAMEQL